MISKRIPEIETKRLLLRQATTADPDAWAERVFAGSEVIRFMPKRNMTPLQRAERAFHNYKRLWQARIARKTENNMSNRRLFVIGMTMILLALLLAGCAQPPATALVALEPTDTPEPTAGPKSTFQAAATATTAPASPLELVWETKGTPNPLRCAGYFAHPSDLLSFTQDFRSGNHPFTSNGWHLKDFLANTLITSNNIQFDL